jgi:hypothetical protein
MVTSIARSLLLNIVPYHQSRMELYSPVAYVMILVTFLPLMWIKFLVDIAWNIADGIMRNSIITTLLFTGAIKKRVATPDIPGRKVFYNAWWSGIFRVRGKRVSPRFYFLFLSRCVGQVLLKYCCHFQLVSSASHFLATVADRAQYKYLFEGPDVLTSICKDVIIPNMVFRGKRMVQASQHVSPYFLCWHYSSLKIQFICPRYF